MSDNIDQLFSGTKRLFIKQIKEWTEILVNVETANKYKLLDENGGERAFIFEKGSGLMRLITRSIFRSHRPLDIAVQDPSNHECLHLTRPFYFFFSELTIRDGGGKVLGVIKRRFAFLSKVYDLEDGQGRVIATIRSPFWKVWTFPVLSNSGQEIATISKKWGGLLSEIFTDSDTFGIEFGSVADEHKPILLAAAISIDLDFFEDNHDG
jgi:uncharacterized protein YxjI